MEVLSQARYVYIYIWFMCDAGRVSIGGGTQPGKVCIYIWFMCDVGRVSIGGGTQPGKVCVYIYMVHV